METKIENKQEDSYPSSKETNSGVKRYILKCVLGLLAGVCITAFGFVLAWIILGSDKVPSSYKEVMLYKTIEFEKKFLNKNTYFYNNPENCVFDFITVEDKVPLKIDLRKVLYYTHCYKSTKCLKTIDGEAYAITPGNSHYMDESNVRNHLEMCASAKNREKTK